MILYAKKLELERLIYSFGVPIEACYGELSSDAFIPHLQVALSVYNAFFAKENKLFLADDIRRERLERDFLNRCYEAEEKRMGAPLPPSFALYTKEREKQIEQELVCREKKLNKNARTAEYAV